MCNWIMYYLLLLHFISDFVLQSREVAIKKSNSFVYMLLHCSNIYTIFGLGLIIIYPFTDSIANFLIVNTWVHFLQDTFIWRSYKFLVRNKPDFKYWESKSFYIVIGFDQMLHVMILMFLKELFL